jgi:hypothetical protein
MVIVPTAYTVSIRQVQAGGLWKRNIAISVLVDQSGLAGNQSGLQTATSLLWPNCPYCVDDSFKVPTAVSRPFYFMKMTTLVSSMGISTAVRPPTTTSWPLGIDGLAARTDKRGVR